MTTNPPPGRFQERLPRGERIPADFEFVRPTGDPSDARTLADWMAYFLDLEEGLPNRFRERLTANRTYYVRTDGNDSNTGLTNTPAGAFLTIQKAWDTVCDSIDLNGYAVTIQVGDGTYTAGVVSSKGVVGGNGVGGVTIQGNLSNAAAVVISTTSANCFAFDAGFGSFAKVTLQYMELRTSVSGKCIAGSGGGCSISFSNIRFGACANIHVYSEHHAFVASGNYAVVGNAPYHIWAQTLGILAPHGGTITFSNSPVFTTFALAGGGGQIYFSGCTFVNGNTVTGQRFYVAANSVIATGNAGEAFLPGTTAGVRLSGGIYDDVGNREALNANRTYYVRTDGSDSNTGLANTSGGAFLTIQKAVDAALSIDTCGYAVTIQVADGTYTGAVSMASPMVGSGSLTIVGNIGTPTNVIVSVTSADCFSIDNGAAVTLRAMKLQTTTSGVGIRARRNARVNFLGIDFGACVSGHIISSLGAQVVATSNYTISGGGVFHAYADGSAYVQIASVTVTISGTPAFTIFAYVLTLGAINIAGVTFSGSATGTRYSVTLNGVINTGGGGASYLPGNSSGSAATGGQYA